MKKKDIIYKWGEDHLMIELGNRIEPHMRVLLWMEFLFTISMASIFLRLSFPFALNLWHSTATIGAAALYILATYRFVTRMFCHEKVLLNKHDLVLVKHVPFACHMRHFAWKSISPLYYTGKQQNVMHQLRSHIDFNIHAQRIQHLHHEGNLCFYYAGYPIHFARNVYSWDAEEMVYMMQLYAGNKLRLSPEFEMILQAHEADDSFN